MANGRAPNRSNGKSRSKADADLAIKQKYDALWNANNPAPNAEAVMLTGAKRNSSETNFKKLWLESNASAEGKLSGQAKQRRNDARGKGKAKRGRKRGSVSRDHSVWLSDLFLWITIVDCCLQNPTSGLSRAAELHGVSPGLLDTKIKNIEAITGMSLFAMEKLCKPGEKSKRRTGFVSEQGAFLATVLVAIEHLWHFALTAKTRQGGVQMAKREIHVVSREIFTGLFSPIQRELEHAKYSALHTPEVRKVRVGYVGSERVFLTQDRKKKAQERGHTTMELQTLALRV